MNNKYIDKTGWMCRLICAINVSKWYEHIKILDLVCIKAKLANVSKVLTYCSLKRTGSHEQRRFWSDFVLLRADLSLFHPKSVPSVSRLRQSIAQSIVCGYLLVPPHQGSSNKLPQSIFATEITNFLKKNLFMWMKIIIILYRIQNLKGRFYYQRFTESMRHWVDMKVLCNLII